MTVSQTHANTRASVLAHVAAARPADSRRKTQNDGVSARSTRNMTQGNRRMVAVTVALSEPADSTPLDWADTIAANLRLIYANTTVEVLDAWRADE